MENLGTDQLAALYEECGSISALARRIGRPQPTVRYWLVKAGIPLKSKGFRSPKSRSRKGPDHHKWRGGTYISTYVWQYAPGHPACGSKPYVRQHRLVMEQALGRFLADTEDVHHVNGDKLDNRLENLRLVSHGTHLALHARKRRRDQRGRFMREDYGASAA